jgi:hypothetical protein
MDKFDTLFKTLLEAVDVEYDVDETEFDFAKHIQSVPAPFTPQQEGSQLPIFKHKLFELALLEAYDAHKPLIIYGESGIGKSVHVDNIAKKYFAPDMDREFVDWASLDGEAKMRLAADPSELQDKYVYIDTRVAGFEPADVRGMEIPGSEYAHMMPRAPLWAYFMSRPGSAGILFLDELNQGQQQVLNAFYSVILDKTAAELKFTEGWTTIAAGNIGDAHMAVNPLPAALTQRFDTIYLVADIDSWLEWANGEDETEFEGTTAVNVQGLHPTKSGKRIRIHPFIQAYAQSDEASTFYLEADAESDASTPNPRNLTFFSDQFRKILYYYEHPENKARWITGDFLADVQRSAVKTLGVDWAAGFIQFIKIYSRLNWEGMAEDPKKYATENMSDTFAYLQFIANKVNKTMPDFAAKIDQMHDEFEAGTLDISQYSDVGTFIWQLAQIVTELIFKIEWTGKKSDMSSDAQKAADAIEKEVDGEGELVAILLGMIRQASQENLENIAGALRILENTPNADKSITTFGKVIDKVLQMTTGLR